jgi:hypothetical protein
MKTGSEVRNQSSAAYDNVVKGWEEERANFSKEIDEQRAALQKQNEDDMAVLVRKHKDDLNEQMMGFVSLQEGINKKMTTENEELRQQLEIQKKQWDEEKEELERKVSEIQGAAENL